MPSNPTELPCIRCGEIVSVKSGTRKILCASCRPLGQLEWRKAYYRKSYTPEAARAKYLKSNYNLTPDDVDLMLQYQDGVCAICGSNEWGGSADQPKVDHEHGTSRIRGLLCQSCNLMIGHARDRVDLLQKGIEYLNQWSPLEVRV